MGLLEEVVAEVGNVREEANHAPREARPRTGRGQKVALHAKVVNPRMARLPVTKMAHLPQKEQALPAEGLRVEDSAHRGGDSVDLLEVDAVDAAAHIAVGARQIVAIIDPEDLLDRRIDGGHLAVRGGERGDIGEIELALGVVGAQPGERVE